MRQRPRSAAAFVTALLAVALLLAAASLAVLALIAPSIASAGPKEETAQLRGDAGAQTRARHHAGADGADRAGRAPPRRTPAHLSRLARPGSLHVSI